mgnify:CR=1 FL=1
MTTRGDFYMTNDRGVSDDKNGRRLGHMRKTSRERPLINIMSELLAGSQLVNHVPHALQP